MDDHGSVLPLGELVETIGELAQGNQHRALDPRRVGLFGFAHIEEQEALSRLAPPCHLGRALLLHRALVLGVLDPAEVLIVDELGERRRVAAGRTRGVLLQLELGETHVERVVLKEAPHQAARRSR